MPESYDWSYLSEVTYKNTSEHLVSLDDLFSIVGNQKTLFLDIKSNNKIDTKIAHSIVDSIQNHNLKESVFVESFNPITLGSIRLYDRGIMLMYDFADNTKAYGEESQEQFNKIPWFLTQHWMQKQIRRIIRPDVLGPRFNIDHNVLKQLLDYGYPIVSWTIDDPKLAKSLYESGVKGLQSNNPQLIEDVVIKQEKKILDAGGSSAVVDEMIKVTDVIDIQDAIKKAAKEKKSINIAGRRHSMGGQTLSERSVMLNMLSFNAVSYNEDTKTVTAQAGATWKKIQEILALHGRSVKVMQSDNIFTVGGSIGVNVHGWQVGAAPIGSTILKMTVVTSDGKIHKISPKINRELFNAVIGGYGMFAVIVDAELITVPDSMTKFHAVFADTENFNNIFEQNITKNPRVELVYARLSMDQDNLLDKVGLFWYENQNDYSEKNSIAPEKLVAFKRSLFRLSEYHNLGKKLRWYSEQTYAQMLAKNDALLSRNDAMNTDIHILWPLYGSNKDILHEYFVPKKQINQFIKQLKNNVIKYNINMLNVTIREVRQDVISGLPYANQDVYGLVCLFSQGRTTEDEERMRLFTESVIDEAINLGGTFYLPYRLHYNGTQLLSAYPKINDWLKLKKKYDPNLVFQSQFFNYINKIVSEGE